MARGRLGVLGCVGYSLVTCYVWKLSILLIILAIDDVSLLHVPGNENMFCLVA